MIRVRASVLTLSVVLSACAAVLPASASAGVSVRRGSQSFTRIFPNDASSVRDPNQATGRRVHFRRGVDYPVVGGWLKRRCTSATYSICDAFAELNKLDGFDLQPRVTVPFNGNIRLSSVRDATVSITTDRGNHFVSGLRQVTFDPRSHVLAGISDKFLKEGARYRIRVTNGVRDSRGHRVNACGHRRVCSVRFTTRTASGELVRIRRALDLPLSDPSNAYRLAHFPGASSSTGSRRLFLPNVFRSATIPPSIGGPTGGIVRNDQVNADGTLKSSVVPNLIAPGRSGFFAFGSFLSPRYQYASSSAHTDRPYGRGGGVTDGEIPPVTSKRTPRPFGADRLGVIVVTPDPTMHPPPWPTAVYGPGFTRSKFDIFVSADNNAAQGIMTVATDPSGHSYGHKSTITVTSGVTKTTFPSYGRGRDLDGDGDIGTGLNDGVGPTGHKRAGKSELPSRKPLDGVQSGLVQTTVDDMALGRALKAGLTIPTISSSNLVNPDQIYYYGLSFGGIYGTMLMGTDPLFHRGLLNVPGGPIADIARLSGFRNNLADQVRRSRPNLLNGGPGLNGFTEDLPLRNEPARVITHRGAGVLQELFGESNWYDRSGSPETFAPRIRLRPDAAWAKNPKQVAFQTAYADGTVPNPTAGTLYRAGALFDRVTYYRNDKTPTFDSNPHGFLADPSLAGRSFGQQQLTGFLATGQITNPNPAFFEFPIANRNNLECLHYPDPQTGQPQTRQAFPASGDCPPPPARR